MGLKIEDALPKAKWAEFARLKNRIDPREVVPALPNKYFPIVVRAASRDEIDDIPRDLYTVTVLATVGDCDRGLSLVTPALSMGRVAPKPSATPYPAT